MVNGRVIRQRLSHWQCQRQGTSLHCTVVSHSFQLMTGDAGNSAKRIRVGLTGLAIVFLFVVFASVVSRSRDDDLPPQTQPLNEAEPNEPLADLGVAPGGDAAANNAADGK
jgi:hypothetical protein